MNRRYVRMSAWCCVWLLLLWSWDVSAGQAARQCVGNKATCAKQEKPGTSPKKLVVPAPAQTPAQLQAKPRGVSGRIVVGWLMLGLGAALIGGSSAIFGILASKGNELNLARKAHSDGDCDLIKEKSHKDWGSCADTLSSLQTQQVDYEFLSGVAMATFAAGVVVLLSSAVVLGIPEGSKAKKTPPPTAKPKAPPQTSDGPTRIMLLQLH